MNIKAIRRKNMRQLAASIGGVSALANILKKSQSQISHLIGKNPQKNIGDNIAKQVEQAFHKPAGWLDIEHRSIAKSPNKPSTPSAFTPVPIIHWHEASIWNELMGTYCVKNNINQVAVRSTLGENTFALRLQNKIVIPPNKLVIPTHSILVVDPDGKLQHECLVITKLYPSDKMATIKQYVIDGKQRLLHDLSTQPISHKLSELTIICGIVKQIIIDIYH